MPRENRMSRNLDPETVITNLPFRVLDQLSGYLDIPDGTNKPYWKALIAVLPEDMYTDVQINRFSLEGLRLNGGSSSLSLLRDLGNRYGKTVKQLASYLDRLHYEEALKLVKMPEPLSITQRPVSSNVVEGNAAMFSCKAKGFPYPRYQWYRAFTRSEGGEIIYEEVDGAADAVLDIKPVALEDAGGYCCKIYHIPSGKESSLYTEWAYLTVIVAPSGERDRTFPNGQLYSPPVIHKQPDANVRVGLGKELVLTCRASGCPQPEYQWYKYEDDPRTGTTKRELLKGYDSEGFRFAQATSRDRGQYICHVRNSKGEAWSVTVTVTIETINEQLKRKCRIEILRHPVGVMCVTEMDQNLECVASCASAKLYYQWFKNDQLMEGETNNQLCFHGVKRSDAGIYFCRVTAENGHAEDSEKAQLKVPSSTPSQVCQAVDKVALLIGNEDYRSGDTLVAPGNDMSKLAAKLQSEQMNFKVVSLLDLTLTEMRKALDIFCSLLSKGVYGLFYFSGHGFEHDGQTYMVPHDAPAGYLPADCMCAQEALQKMQEKDTALNVILLDICRKFNDLAPGPVEKYKPVVKGNTVFGYAAQCNSEAFELKSQGYAIFTKYLVKRIHECENVFLLLSKILADVKRDQDAGNKQFPALMGDLNDNRTLLDEIIYTGYTAAFNSCQEKWENAHVLSQDMVLPFHMGIHVTVKFQEHFSNVMHVHLLVDKGTSAWCAAELGHFPPGLDIEVREEDWNVPTADGRVEVMRYRTTKVKNIQRLRADLMLRLIVQYEFQGQNYREERDILVGRPLIADVWLLDEQEEERAPMENEEYPDSSTNSLLSCTDC